MLPLAQVRAILGTKYAGVSDGVLEEFRDQLSAMCPAINRAYQSRLSAAVSGLGPEERLEVEERAAILEFDAKLSRANAERLALATVIPLREKKPCGLLSTAASRRKNKPVT